MSGERNRAPGRCATDAKTLEIEERRGKVYELRHAGWSIPKIAKEIGVAISTVHGDLVAVLDRMTAETNETANQARTIDLQRLDAAQMALWPSVEAGETAAIDTYLRLQARRSKLLGLDAPEQQIHSVTTASPEEAARLVREAFGERATPRRDAPDGDPA